MCSTLIVAFPAAGLADMLPSGGTVTSGNASIITPGPRNMVIHQGSDRAVVNWNGFSIGRGAGVDIRQPSQGSAILNRVTGDTTSRIHGSLTANGQVHVVNPNGILIGREGRIITGGGFVASTLDITDEDFQAGRLSYRGQGASAGVVNRGAITVGRGGYAALIGGRIDNSGTITAPLGRIGLGAGERVTLDLSGDGFMQVALPSQDDGNEDALIRNSGTVSADGGRIEMTAATARNAARNAINLSGVAEARTVSVHNGAIVLGGGNGGAVRVSGTVSTRAARAPARLTLNGSDRPPRPTGGQIDIAGAHIALTGATLDASGDGGGRIRIGGDFAGAGNLQRAATTTADAGTVILADALSRGDGGRVVQWSDQRTGFAGNISARGGNAGGDGGFVEVSSAGRLTYAGRTDLRAPAGDWGRLLLDPTDISVPGTISVEDVQAQLALGSLTLDTSVETTDGDAGDILITQPIAWTTGSTFELLADRDISIIGAINGENGVFALDAGRDVVLGPVNVNTFILSSGNLTQQGPALPSFTVVDFRLNGAEANFLRVAGGSGTTADPYLLQDVYGLQGMDSYAYLDADFALETDIDATGTAGWNDFGEGIGGFNPIGDIEDAFTGTLDGRGFAIDGLYIGGGTASEAGLFHLTDGAQIRDLDLLNLDITGESSAAGVVAMANDTVLENVSATGLIATEGFSFASGGSLGGLVGYMSGGSIANSSFDGLIEERSFAFGGRSYPAIGGIVGYSDGATLDTVSSAGQINALGTSGAFAGGIAGVSGFETTITDAVSSVDIRGDMARDDSLLGDTFIAGGLVGENYGLVSFSHATGAVESVGAEGGPVDDSSVIGGLVGSNFGEIADSSATGDVTVDTRSDLSLATVQAGGLIGANWGAVSRSFASGDMTVTSSDSAGVGGFVGQNSGDITDAFSSGAVSHTQAGERYSEGGEVAVGGFAGLNALSEGEGAATLTRTAARGAVVVAVDDLPVRAGGHTGANYGGEIIDSYANGAVSSSSDSAQQVGGLIGYTIDGAVTNSYASGAVSTTGDDATQTGGLIGFNLSDADAPTTEVTGSYWDITTAGQEPEGLAGYGSPITTAEFQDTAGFMALAGWDFDETWTPGDTGAYPAIYTIDRVIFARPEPFELQYGQTEDAATTGTISGGPSVFVFAPYDDTLDTSPVFQNLIFPDINVGSGQFTLATSALTSGAGFTYRVVDLPAAYQITPAPLTITALDQRKTYGQQFTFDGSEFTSAGLMAWDSIDGVALTSAGAAATAAVAGSPYAITAGDAAGEGLANYDISYVAGQMEVDPASLTITALDQRKTYGQQFLFDGSEFISAGLMAWDSIDGVALTSAGAAATAAVAGSPYAITAGDAAGDGLANYDISYAAGQMEVDPASLTITALDQRKTYGQQFLFDGSEFTSAGLMAWDSIDGVALASAGADPTAAVAGGPYAITAGDAAGEGLANYDISYAAGQMEIDPASLTITALDQRKTYGQQFTFDGSEFISAGLVAWDSIDGVALASAGADQAAVVAGSPYAITAGDAAGEGLANYDISYAAGQMEVDPASLTITALDQRKTYGQQFTFDGSEFISAGLMAWDSIDGVALASAGADQAAVVAGSPYAITAGDAAGEGLANYDISYVAGQMEVVPAIVDETPTADNVPRPPVTMIPALPNPADTILITLGGQGATVVTGSGPASAAALAAENILAQVDRFAAVLEIAAENCSQSDADVGRYLACLSDALDAFADRLDEISVDLPPGMENVAEIVRDARRNIDSARSRAEQRLATATTDAERAAIRADAIGEARQAIAGASTEIRKAIALVRAEDPELARVQAATITRVVEAVDSVGIELSRAVGL
ncbi:MBG domain-containing protein [Paracoccus alcaliphilus]|uniref:MBG domain-containing protein n=1 Tax=Paracoccus alcaliphilus TaxID=34002 RepID=UPI000AD58C9A|nr:MBG domain-containing protein [Paracoccus alcaliphilus]WCR20965.1 filamentous hemagglutinin N-terminal domain-containing protein [Paracoccus alcaliphilus]